jgi:hypothetical protein
MSIGIEARDSDKVDGSLLHLDRIRRLRPRFCDFQHS